MVIYHLGFGANTYLAAKVFPGFKVIECQPLTDEVSSIMRQIEGDKDFLFHIDLSVQDRIPGCRGALIEALISAEIAVHNAFHMDQRKRHLQKTSRELGLPSLTATKEGDPEEKLLVKSDLNVGGGPERRALSRFPRMPVPALPSRVTSPFEYYASRRKNIPEEMWNDETLHIERCIENPKGIVLRTFWNQGKAVVSIIENPHEIVKKRNEKCRRWNDAQPIDSLTETAFARMRLYADHLKLSFFAADFVVAEDNSAYLVDLNLTPQWAVNAGTHINNMTPELPIYDIPQALRLV
jgi:hypothetical protein